VLAADQCVFRTRAICASDLYVGTTERQPYVFLDAPVFRDGEVEFARNVAVRAQHLASLLWTTGRRRDGQCPLSTGKAGPGLAG
jgi:hypothetical protein